MYEVRKLVSAVGFELAVVAALLVIGLIPSMHAQESNVEVKARPTTSITGAVQVSIPFQFSADGVTLDAGTYSVAMTNERGLVIQNVSGKQSIVVLTNAVESGSPVISPKLVFHKYGDQYFLTQTWLGRSDTGRQLFASSEELKWARDSRNEELIMVAGE